MIDDNQKLRQDMIYLLGQLEAIQYPIVCHQGQDMDGYYHLLGSIRDQYVSILKRTVGYKE